MGGASEQVTGSVVTCTAGGTGGVPGRADPRFVGVEESAMAGSELGQGGAVGAGKGKLFPLDKGRGGLEDGVWCKLADGSLHRRGVKVCQGCFVGGGVCPPIGEQMGDRWEEAGLEGLLFGSGTGG